MCLSELIKANNLGILIVQILIMIIHHFCIKEQIVSQICT